MSRYHNVKESLRGIESQLQIEKPSSVLLVVDLPDHREELGSVHIDATRAVLDWVCKRWPNSRLCLGAASRQNTDLAFREFGYVHLRREYPALTLTDLNIVFVPEGEMVIFLSGAVAGSSPSARWGKLLSVPEYRYTPTGYMWQRKAQNELQTAPQLVIVDATVVRDEDHSFEPCVRREGRVFAGVDLNTIDRLSCEVL